MTDQRPKVAAPPVDRESVTDPGRATASPPLVAASIIPFDPRRPGRLSAGHRRVLGLVTEAFARRLSLTLAARLRVAAHVGPAEVGQLSYGEFVAVLPDPACLTVVALPPLAGAAVLHLSIPIALACVERLCGGGGSSPPDAGTSPSGGIQPDRALTEIEQTLLAAIIANVLADLATAFVPVAPFTAQVLRREAKPALVKAAPSTTPLVLLAFPLTLGDSAGTLEVALPFLPLENPLDAFDGHGQADRDALTDRIESTALMARGLLDAAVEMSVRLGPVTLTPAEILDLAVGDVLTLHHPTVDPLELLVAGQPCMTAVIGRRGRRLACRIVEPDTDPASPVGKGTIR